jgi:hypothetical protein
MSAMTGSDNAVWLARFHEELSQSGALEPSCALSLATGWMLVRSKHKVDPEAAESFLIGDRRET